MYTFDKVLGHGHVIKSLQNSICQKMISHAYLFCGKSGAGKSLIANTFAKTLSCEKNNINPCNKCISCVTFESGNNTDIIYVSEDDKKSIGVDTIREKIVKQMETKPYYHKYKIFIVDVNDSITVQAQNALLKTIEEPAEYGIFLLLAESENMFLPTILSRVVKFGLKPIPQDLVYNYLIDKLPNIKEDEAVYYSILSDGNIGYAKKIASDIDFLNIRNNITKLLLEISNYDISKILNTAKELEEFKDNIKYVFQIMNFWFRDLLIYGVTKDEKLILQKDLKHLIIKNSEVYSIYDIVKKFAYIQKAKEELKRYASFQLVMEVLLFNLNERIRKIT